jgi:hypothetical protein
MTGNMPDLFLVDRLQRDFESFHQANPEVYARLVALARAYLESGRPREGIGHLWEVMRWQLWLETRRGERDPYRLNNNWRSRYARLIMEREPDLAQFFETRRLRSAFDSGAARSIR